MEVITSKMEVITFKMKVITFKMNCDFSNLCNHNN
jgi:hypothetical protein